MIRHSRTRVPLVSLESERKIEPDDFLVSFSSFFYVHVENIPPIFIFKFQRDSKNILIHVEDVSSCRTGSSFGFKTRGEASKRERSRKRKKIRRLGRDERACSTRKKMQRSTGIASTERGVASQQWRKYIERYRAMQDNRDTAFKVRRQRWPKYKRSCKSNANFFSLSLSLFVFYLARVRAFHLSRFPESIVEMATGNSVSRCCSRDSLNHARVKGLASDVSWEPRESRRKRSELALK